jgi:hypothetical protein
VEIETRPVRALVILEVAARAHREHAADLAQHAAQPLHVRVRAEVARPVLADVTGHRQAGHVLLHADLDVREALVVLQQDVVGRVVPPDHRGLEQQRLGLRGRHDRVDVHGAGHHLPDPGLRLVAREVVPDTEHQALGLAHIQHLAAGALERVDAR